VAHLLIDAGAILRAFEPFKPEGLPGIPMVSSLEEAVKEAQAILLLVRHSQFQEIQPAKMASITPARLVVDTINAWEPASWEASGFTLFRLGDSR